MLKYLTWYMCVCPFYAPVNIFHAPPSPGITREWAVKASVGEITNIESFYATGGP